MRSFIRLGEQVRNSGTACAQPRQHTTTCRTVLLEEYMPPSIFNNNLFTVAVVLLSPFWAPRSGVKATCTTSNHSVSSHIIICTINE